MTPSEVYVYLDAFKQDTRIGGLTVDQIEDLEEMKRQPAPVVNGVQTKWL